MKRHPSILAFALALASGCAAAADVGRVVLAAGDTSALRQGQVVKLALGTAVQDRDVLRTGPASNLQVRFEDDSYVSLREASELRVDEFRFGGGAGKESAVFSLLKGGLRAVTGLIGQQNHDDYKMQTRTATIGIRGTDYAATDCRGDCKNRDGSPAKDGVYGRVIGQSRGTNRIEISNDADRRTLGINSNFFIGDRKTGVELLLVAPEFVLSKLEGRIRGGSKGAAGGSGSEKASAGGAAQESRPSSVPPPLPQLPIVIAGNLGPQPLIVTEGLAPGGTPAVLAPANGFVVAFPGKPGLEGAALFDGDGLTATFNGQNQILTVTDGVTTASLAGGSIVDTGSYALPNGQTFVWGRWTGATSVPLFNGSTYVQTAGVPLLFGTATGVQNDRDIVGAIGGVVTYNYVGGPKPVDGGGNVGSITTAATTVNFTTLQQTYTLGMNFPSIMVGASNTGPAVFNLSGAGVPNMGSGGEFIGGLSGTCSGGGCYTTSPGGYFQTGFTGPNGYDIAVATGIVFGTQAGEVAFINLHQASSYTPGPLPAPPLSGQLAWADPVYAPASTFSVGSGPYATFSSSSPYYLQSFANPSPCSVGTCTLSGALGPGTVANQGSTSLSDGGTMYWGRWAGGQITDRISGTPTTYAPPGGVSFVLGDMNSTLPTSGAFLYSFAGGPPATNTSGAVGSSLSQGAFSVTFGANLTMSVGTPLQFAVAGSNFSLNQLATVNATPCSAGVCTVSQSAIQNMTFNATCSGSCTSVSFAQGTNFFVGPQAAGMAVAGNVTSNVPTATFAGAFKRP